MHKPLTHLNEQGQPSMVDVSDKKLQRRTAKAEGFFCAKKETIDAVLCGNLPKGEAISVARIAGIQSAKCCDSLIPLCHPLPLEYVDVQFDRHDDERIRITSTVIVTGKTGVEMEALTAVSIATLTLWDMVKAIDTSLSIEGITLIEKRKEELT